MSQDQQFDAVMSAFARYNSRPRLTPEQQAEIEREYHRRDPKHIKALKRRRKRKRGGPK